MEKVRNFVSENGVEYSVFAEGWSTRYSWGHYAEMRIDGVVVSNFRCRYINRTWECYRFQSVCKGAISSYLERLECRLKEEFLQSIGLKRLSPKRKDEFNAFLNANQEYKDIKHLYEMV